MVLSRRSLVAATVLAPVAGLAVARPVSAWAAPTMPAIRLRADWAGALAPKGPLADEDDVRFLLVHHTLTPNTDTAERIPERLRSVFRFHTTERGWADVAYNFFVDPSGTIWEGRAGSLERPVKGDATGGSQGHALLCCFVGDFTAQAPTPAAMAAMTQLLAWLAGRHALTLNEPVTFVSRGSSRRPAGVEVTTEQVAAHRDMSRTECPGDALYPLVGGQLQPDARALLAPVPTPSPTPTGTPTPGPTPTPSPASEQGPAVSDDVLRTIGGGALALGLGGVLAATFGRRGRGSAADQVGDDDRPADGQGAEQAQEEPDQGA